MTDTTTTDTEHETAYWYRATFPDRGAGKTKTTVYLEAKGEAHARERASRISDITRVYDPSQGRVRMVAARLDGILRGLLRGGPNRAYPLGETDDPLTSRDVDADDLPPLDGDGDD